MRYDDENIWLTQKMMATLYDVDVRTINYHVKKIFSDSELQEDSVIRKFRITAADGKSYSTNHYSLEMIIAVGFKVNSERAVQFRKWVNQIAKDYTIKGWVMDDERLKNGGSILTTEYFDRLLEQIREIRLSERRFYQKITDIYATALDYDRTAKTTKQFFAKVQNKMHYAVHGHTAAELIYERADANKPHMGLATWAAAPEGKIVKSDVSVAKNYLSEQEMRSLERIVSAYLDLAEDRAERHIPMTMEDWAKRLDLFLMADDREILQDAGKITAEIAKAKAETEFEKYRVVQDRLFMSDFDKYMLELEENAKKQQGCFSLLMWISRSNKVECMGIVPFIRPKNSRRLILRNLLLNENNPLHNRTMHISGMFNDLSKANIDEMFGAKTAAHVKLLFERFTYETVFGRSDVMEAIGIKATRAYSLLKELYERDIIEPVTGFGKGKYRFKRKQG